MHFLGLSHLEIEIGGAILLGLLAKGVQYLHERIKAVKSGQGTDIYYRLDELAQKVVEPLVKDAMALGTMNIPLLVEDGVTQMKALIGSKFLGSLGTVIGDVDKLLHVHVLSAITREIDHLEGKKAVETSVKETPAPTAGTTTTTTGTTTAAPASTSTTAEAPASTTVTGTTTATPA